MNKLFDISKKTCIITGASGLLGKKHIEAVLEGNGIPIILGRTKSKLELVRKQYEKKYNKEVMLCVADITDRESLFVVRKKVLEKYGRIDILINNAANNPKVETESINMKCKSFVTFPQELWDADIEVGLTGTLNCCQIFGEVMQEQRSGVILNISSDYGILAPDQRLYFNPNLPDDEQQIKPISYSVVKHGIIGMTKYLAAYWGNKGIRVNTLCPSGIYDGQNEEFVKRFIQNVPMMKMSKPEEYVGSILYLISDASSFVNGATVVVDGGKSIW